MTEITREDTPFAEDNLPFDVPRNAPPHLQGFDNLDENDLRRKFIKNKTAGAYALALHIVKKFNIITVGEKEYEMYVYRDGTYFQAVNEIIYPEIQSILGPITTSASKREVFGLIASMTMKPREVFASSDPRYIPVRNGVYDRDTHVLLPHDPKYRFTFQFPVIYDADASCPLTDAFLDTVLDSEQRLTVEEWLGYFFLRSYMFKKAIIFVGEGDTGKTTLLEAISFLLGPQNISSVSLQKMSGDKFAAAHLYGKHGNIVDELSAKDVTDTGAFKIATGGGSITGEMKFGNQFSFQNHSKLTFACNKIPDVKDFDDDAYFNRWMVVRFEKTIEKKVPNFIKTLTTEAERSGFFNLAMRGLDRLLVQGRFSYNKDAMDTKREMMRSGSSIAIFAAEKLAQENGAEMSKEDLYDVYTQFCSERGIAAETIKMLGTKLPFYVPYISEGHISSTRSLARVRGWRNVKVIADDSMDFEDYGSQEA
jgi:putative DNA primase/helicase